jgi:hypothetical protein
MNLRQRLEQQLLTSAALTNLGGSCGQKVVTQGSHNFPHLVPTLREKNIGTLSIFPLSELPLYRVFYFQHMFFLWKRVPSRNVLSHCLNQG